MALARLGHHGDTGGEQPPPPTVPSVWHAGFVADAERDAPVHSALQKSGGVEALVLGSGEGAGGHLRGIHLLWETPGYGELLLIPREGDLGGIQKLWSGGQEIFKFKGCVEQDDKNPQQGGSGDTGVRIFL